MAVKAVNQGKSPQQANVEFLVVESPFGGSAPSTAGTEPKASSGAGADDQR